jgi:hypothetical protein
VKHLTINSYSEIFEKDVTNVPDHIEYLTIEKCYRSNMKNIVQRFYQVQINESEDCIESFLA